MTLQISSGTTNDKKSFISFFLTWNHHGDLRVCPSKIKKIRINEISCFSVAWFPMKLDSYRFWIEQFNGAFYLKLIKEP